MMCRCFYCKYFLRYDSLTHDIWKPVKELWFAFPRFLWKKTYKGIEEGNMKFQLWHGFYIWPIPEQGAMMPYWWPKIVKFNIKFLFTKNK